MLAVGEGQGQKGNLSTFLSILLWTQNRSKKELTTLCWISYRREKKTKVEAWGSMFFKNHCYNRNNLELGCPIEKTSVWFSRSVMSDSLQPHGLQHARPPCPSPTPGVYSNSCPLCPWCHPTISSSVIAFSSCLLSFPAPGSFQMSQFFTSGGQSIETTHF